MWPERLILLKYGFRVDQSAGRGEQSGDEDLEFNTIWIIEIRASSHLIYQK